MQGLDSVSKIMKKIIPNLRENDTFLPQFAWVLICFPNYENKYWNDCSKPVF